MILRFFLLISVCSTLFFSCEKKPALQAKISQEVKKEVLEEKYGYILNDFEVVSDTIHNGDSFGGLLDAHGVKRSKVFEIVNSVKDSFNVARITSGKPYTILKCKDNPSDIEAFIYQKNKVKYTVLHIEDSIYAENKSKKVLTRRSKMSGVIDSSLSKAVEDAGSSAYLSHLLSGVYQWSIDFFKIQKGDRFKVIYNEQYLEDGTFVGIKNVEAAVFEHAGSPFYAFEYGVKNEDQQLERSFYDENAKSLQSFFLKAPLKFSRISSRFSPRRYHPVQKRWKAHKGTDYAAPRGTPILSTANGTVIKAGYTSGNGRYVKIKHNRKYSTQYLHMSKILVKKGQFVKQGQVIGKVGSTGLATGPHVCYRFWVNGKQRDPYRQKLPSAKNLEEKYKQDYFSFIKPLKYSLDSITYPNTKIEIDNGITVTKPNTNKSLESITRSL